jgi:hypothetical protein
MRATALILLFSILTSTNFGQAIHASKNELIIANGGMPNMATDKKSNVHVVYGTGDSIMYVLSANQGKSFSSPQLVAVLPKLFANAMRGPQIATTHKGIVITACTTTGNIFSYTKEGTAKWTKAMKVNHVDEVAKEGLMSLSADGPSVFAVWLAVKSPKGQNVYGAKSVDGGKTWSKNILVYASPDNTVCECCKPSVVVKGNNVYVMFRNWLNDNRDLYLASSVNGGVSFNQAQKLGTGSWKLNGCPMDGGGLAVNKNGVPQTVWRREAKIYSSTPGVAEKEIGQGRGCVIETINNENVYAWSENGDVVIMKRAGQKKVVGKGSLPIIKGVDNDHVICVWENDKQIYALVEEI